MNVASILKAGVLLNMRDEIPRASLVATHINMILKATWTNIIARIRVTIEETNIDDAILPGSPAVRIKRDA